MSFLRATLGSCKTATIRVFALTIAILLGALTPAWAARDEKGQLFDGPGGKLYYEVIGSGNATPLVLVNGGPGFDHTYFHTSSAWDSLAKNRRIIFTISAATDAPLRSSPGSLARWRTRSMIWKRCARIWASTRWTCWAARGAAISAWRMPRVTLTA